ncbi:hypothetical protein [uncultured Brevundimonas sp.]|uniref:hypothetical protein n=1 Tax=uncultured Brevundimonas sp. TaxID=213418 RepID=UPI0030ED023F|tara:strand:- start:108 stop:338 length:231 start_codon:yes stop_codon:yes gene_type:complete
MIRRFLKGLGLFLIVAAPCWGLFAVVFTIATGGWPESAQALGAVLDSVFRNVIPTIVAGGGLWLLASIDERLEQRA